MDQNEKTQAVERLKQATNVLVTVRSDPTVDQLAACIGLTLMLNKLKKHATAVFSGKVPSTLEFLKPEETLEHSPDSLRDFIISLDKSKADKLRYKVEENVVRIFITPYRTSISENDLDFSQGDFNVDAVVALGVKDREDLDRAITEHGRILHDATVITITNEKDVSGLGAINWQDSTASSLSEMIVSSVEMFEANLLDTQMATAFLTGIVAETDRFSNDKTSPRVMTVSAQLMAAGANQQLIANKLDDVHDLHDGEAATVEKQTKAAEEHKEKAKKPDGELDIDHEKPEGAPDFYKNVEEQPNIHDQTGQSDALDFGVHEASENENVEEDEAKEEEPVDSIHIDEHGTPHFLDKDDEPEESDAPKAPKTAMEKEDYDEPPEDNESKVPTLKHDSNQDSPVIPPASSEPSSHGEHHERNIKPLGEDDDSVDRSKSLEDQTLTDIEEAVHSPHVGMMPENTSVVPEQVFAPSNGDNSQPPAGPSEPSQTSSPEPPFVLPPTQDTPQDFSLPPAPTGPTEPSAPSTPMPNNDFFTPHLSYATPQTNAPIADVNGARDAVNNVMSNMDASGLSDPLQAVGSQPLGSSLQQPTSPAAQFTQGTPPQSDSPALTMPPVSQMPQDPIPPTTNPDPGTPLSMPSDPSAPPPVPPPIMNLPGQN